MARRNYHTSGVDIPLPPYFGEDGKEYSTYLDMVAANRKYRQQEERNEMLDEQVNAIREQNNLLNEINLREKKKEESEFKKQVEELDYESRKSFKERQNLIENNIEEFSEIEKEIKKEINKLKRSEKLTKKDQKQLNDLINKNYHAKYVLLSTENIKLYTKRKQNNILYLDIIYDENKDYEKIFKEEKKLIRKLSESKSKVIELKEKSENIEKQIEQIDYKIDQISKGYEGKTNNLYKDMEHRSELRQYKQFKLVFVWAFLLVISLMPVFVIPVYSLSAFVIIAIVGYILLANRNKKNQKEISIIQKHKENRLYNEKGELDEEVKELFTKKEELKEENQSIKQAIVNLKIYGEEEPIKRSLFKE